MATKCNVKITTLVQYEKLKQEGFEFEGQSYLFWEYVRLFEDVKKINPEVRFLLENVSMTKDNHTIISKTLGVEPVMIDSNLVSAQNRKRLYWSNIKGDSSNLFGSEIGQPEDRGILLRDIVHENLDEIIDTPAFNVNPSGKGMNGAVRSVFESKSSTLTTNKGEGSKIAVPLAEYIVPFDKTLQILDKEVDRGKIGYFKSNSQGNRVYSIHGKAVTISASSGGKGPKACLYLFGCITPSRINKRQNGQRFNNGQKFFTLTTQDQHGILIEGYIRKLTPVEGERLQTLKENYTEGVSKSQRYKCLGNGWTVDVIVHIMKGIA